MSAKRNACFDIPEVILMCRGEDRRDGCEPRVGAGVGSTASNLLSGQDTQDGGRIIPENLGHATTYTVHKPTHHLRVRFALDQAGRSAANALSSESRAFIFGLAMSAALAYITDDYNNAHTSSNLDSRLCFSSCNARRFSASSLVLRHANRI
jgi:hypothetical protein